jgi:hypothetical protein
MATIAERIAALQNYIAQATAEINRLWSTQGVAAGVRIQGLRDGITRSQQEIARLQAGVTIVTSGVNPNTINQGDVFNFYIDVGFGNGPYTASYANALRLRMTNDGMRPIAVDDSNLSAVWGGTIVGQAQAEHGYGPWQDVANRIAGMATAAGYSVRYTGNSPRVEPLQRNVAPGYQPNTVGPIYVPSNPRQPSDDKSSSGSLDKVIEDLKKAFKVDGKTLALGALVIFMIWRNKPS